MAAIYTVATIISSSVKEVLSGMPLPNKSVSPCQKDIFHLRLLLPAHPLLLFPMHTGQNSIAPENSLRQLANALEPRLHGSGRPSEADVTGFIARLSTT